MKVILTVMDDNGTNSQTVIADGRTEAMAILKGAQRELLRVYARRLSTLALDLNAEIIKIKQANL